MQALLRPDVVCTSLAIAMMISINILRRVI
jgi:hypothetical protein